MVHDPKFRLKLIPGLAIGPLRFLVLPITNCYYLRTLITPSTSFLKTCVLCVVLSFWGANVTTSIESIPQPQKSCQGNSKLPHLVLCAWYTPHISRQLPICNLFLSSLYVMPTIFNGFCLSTFCNALSSSMNSFHAMVSIEIISNCCNGPNTVV